MSKAKEREVLLNTEIPSELRKRLDEYCKKEGLKIKAVVSKALDEYLRSKGY